MEFLSLSKEERETVIRFDETDDPAVVYTNNIALENRLAKLSENHGQDCRIQVQDGYGGVTYSVPKKWLKVMVPPRLSDAQKEAARISIANARQKKVTMSQLPGSSSSQP